VRAAELYREAGSAGSARAQYNLGVMLLHGQGVPRNLKEASEWLRRASEQGYDPARTVLASLEEGKYTRPADAGDMAAIYREAAERGDLVAQTKLGLLYREGAGVAEDDVRAAEWLHKAAEQGEPEAQAALGTMYDVGEGVAKDLEKAAEWYLRAAENGHPGAQFSLGSMYVNGQGGPRDIYRGLMWLNLSREEMHSSRYLIFRLEGELSEEELAEGRRLAEAWRAAHPLPSTSEDLRPQ
jgi:hypothetical protein